MLIISASSHTIKSLESTMEVDQAITELLGLDPSRTTLLLNTSGAGCSSASTGKIITKLEDGFEKCYFIKMATGIDGQAMVQGEHASLQAIYSAVPTLCPRSFGWGTFRSNPTTSFVAIDYLVSEKAAFPPISLLRSFVRPSARKTLAAKLAKLHSTVVPIPEGYLKPQFGFPMTTCCGDTPQDNSYQELWATFFAENRLKFILNSAKAKHGVDLELQRLVEATISTVVPKLLADDHLEHGRGVVPRIVHGDLWFGNTGMGSLEGRGPEEIVFDPSAFYAHNEYELAIMKMFGRFSDAFYLEYHQLCPKTEPIEEYDDRIALYQVYHHLNHYSMFGNAYRFTFFGGKYKSTAIEIMKRLLQRHQTA